MIFLDCIDTISVVYHSTRDCKDDFEKLSGFQTHGIELYPSTYNAKFISTLLITRLQFCSNTVAIHAVTFVLPVASRSVLRGVVAHERSV
jgi:hypothetical protein